MVDVKKAVKNSLDYLSDMYSDSKDFQDILLEEVEISDDEKYWFITIGFDRLKNDSKSSIIRSLSTPAFHREYKTFKVSTESGNVLSMKIRKDESAIA